MIYSCIASQTTSISTACIAVKRTWRAWNWAWQVEPRVAFWTVWWRGACSAVVEASSSHSDIGFVVSRQRNTPWATQLSEINCRIADSTTSIRWALPTVEGTRLASGIDRIVEISDSALARTGVGVVGLACGTGANTDGVYGASPNIIVCDSSYLKSVVLEKEGGTRPIRVWTVVKIKIYDSKTTQTVDSLWWLSKGLSVHSKVILEILCELSTISCTNLVRGNSRMIDAPCQNKDVAFDPSHIYGRSDREIKFKLIVSKWAECIGIEVEVGPVVDVWGAIPTPSCEPLVEICSDGSIIAITTATTEIELTWISL